MNICRGVLPFIIVMLTLACGSCSEKPEKVPTDCDINSGSCVKEAGQVGLKAVFNITPKPVRSMAEVLFSVVLKRDTSPVTDASVSVDLTMPGMFMGTNRPVLKHVGAGRYEGKGFILRCPSGSRVWKAEVLIGRGGRNYSAGYTFEVKD